MYIKEARRLGIDIVRPDVNESDVLWSVEADRMKPSIRKGLTSVTGIGDTVAEVIVQERDESGSYVNVDDFVDRLPAKPVTGGSAWHSKGELIGKMRDLQAAGALQSLGLSRDGN